MSSELISITKPKRQKHKPQHRNKKQCKEQCEDMESILSESVEQPIKNNSTCMDILTKLHVCISNEGTLNSTTKKKVKCTDTKSNFCSSVQKELKKSSTTKVKVESRKGDVNTNKQEINDKAKQKKDVCKLTKKHILNNDKTLPSNSCKEEEKSKKDSQKSAKLSKLKDTFPDFIPLAKMKSILKSQKPTDVKYIEGHLRINCRMCKHAYINIPDEEQDLLIIGFRDRNRALEGDLVVASINEKDKWYIDDNGHKQKTGTVVCILEKIHPRKAVGILKQDGQSMLFHPRDNKIPYLKIYPESLPKMYNSMPSSYEGVLFLANIIAWRKPRFVIGKIERMLGTIGEIEVELNAILLENDINTEPYPKDLLKELPPAKNILTSTDMEEREDWRQMCVFTIDPATALDLDDALSCTVLRNGNYEIGVHISDVTHYLKSSSPLDVEVAKRATSVYLVNEVHHMLPPELTKACSLLPGEDRLAFSVIWEMTPDAEIVKHRFQKTVVNSCCQMAYEQAQSIIEKPDCPDLGDTFDIKGNFTFSQICDVVKNLFTLSKKLTSKRLANGALRIDQPKLHIAIDKESGLPVSYDILEQKDSNRLIEEFMLLANMTVARHLYEIMPQYALLRNHKHPKKRILALTKDILQKFGIHIDIESSGDLYDSIKRYESYEGFESIEHIQLTKYRMMVINSLCSKAMARATYNCPAKFKDLEDLEHYALSVPYYTHFTSPIRRYPDCVVHRLLHYTISSNVELPQNWSSELCARIAQNCDLRKYNAKVAEKKSIELYFTYFINIIGSMVVTGIVSNVKEHYIEVILCDSGIKLAAFVKDIKNQATSKYDTEYLVPTLTITWKKSSVTQVITVFTIVHLRIEKDTELFQLNAVLLEPLKSTDC